MGRLVLRIVLPCATLLFVLAVMYFRLQAIKPVTDTTRALNKRFGNPALMNLAGRRYFFASAIRHRGRRSGHEFATLIWAVPSTDGYIVSLPFGEGADWVKNVLAAGRATIEIRVRPARSRNPRWSIERPHGHCCLGGHGSCSA